MSEIYERLDVKINATPEKIAKLIWQLGSDEQAEMMHHLLKLAGSEHKLMTQFLYTRDSCEERLQQDPEDLALTAFQTMYASAYKYMLANNYL